MAIKCQKDRCYSPVACGAFGYCRERNFDFPGGAPINQETIKKWQEEDNCKIIKNRD